MVPSSVLVVDDDAGFRAVASVLLAELGLLVVGWAETVVGARAAAHELKPGAALVDVGLPDGDGVELAAELSKLAWRPRVVLTSSDADVITAAEARAVGAAGFLSKAELATGDLLKLLSDTASGLG